MEAFFSQALRKVPRGGGLFARPRGVISKTPAATCPHTEPGWRHSGSPSAGSHRDFGQDVHAPNLRRHPEFASLFLYPHDRSLAANPAFLARGELGRQDQHQLNIGAFFHAGLGVQENAVGANVAGLGCLVRTLGGAHPRGNTGGNSSSAAALGIGSHWLSTRLGVPRYCTPLPQAARGDKDRLSGAAHRKQ